MKTRMAVSIATMDKSAITHLTDQARTGESTSARQAALQELANTHTEASLDLANELIDDPDTTVAADSARLLAYNLAMIGSVTMGQ